MSGTGKSSALVALGRLGFQVVDTDEPGWTEWSEDEGGYVWREDRIAELLAREGGLSAEAEPLLRRTCTHEIDVRQPLTSVVDELAQLGREPSA